MVSIDAHHHLWAPERGDYGWLPEDSATLNRRYVPNDLAPHLAQHGITGTVLVQAAPSIGETEYLLGLADATEWICGVVGWIDFENRDHRRHLERFARHPKFVGLRPMIQDIPDDDWMLGHDLAWAYEAATDLDLVFDALGTPRHLPLFDKLLARHASMRVVIDHCMKPDIRDRSRRAFRQWADGMTRLADRGAFCKFSGLVTEASDDWHVDDLRPYTEHVLSAFGADRVMWGSDWPVCRLAAEYDAWRSAADVLTAHLDGAARAAVFGATAVEAYGLSP